MLEVTDLRLALPDFTRSRPVGPRPKVQILKGIDLNLAQGEALGIVGESGSGKTSLGRTLLRLYRPTGGKILFESKPVPIKHLIASPGVSKDDVERIRAVFLGLDDSKEGQAILDKLGFKGFDAGNEQQMGELTKWLGI